MKRRPPRSYSASRQREPRPFPIDFVASWPVLVGCIGLGLLGGVAAMATSPARYAATAQIMIDPRSNRLLDLRRLTKDARGSSGAIDSEAELLKSETIALAAVRRLNLSSDPSFLLPEDAGFFAGLADALLRLSGQPLPETAAERERIAIDRVISGLEVKRVGNTFVINVTYQSARPERAAAVASAIAESYVQAELEQRFQATLATGHWLQKQLAVTRDAAADAASASLRFKASNNVVETRRGQLGLRDISDSLTQISQARSQTLEAKTRLESFEAIARAGEQRASLAEGLQGEVVGRLRGQYLEAAARERDYSARFGATHEATINIRNQMRAFGQALAAEVDRQVEAARSDYAIKLRQEAELRDKLDAFVRRAKSLGEVQDDQNELDSRARSARSAYDTLLRSASLTSQQEGLTTSDARIIALASVPTETASPKAIRFLPVGAFLGLLGGLGLAIARQRLDVGVRTMTEASRAAHMPCIGLLPELPSSRKEGAPLNHAAAAPHSRFAETMRRIAVELDIASRSRPMRVIGIVSAAPGDGKTTLAANLAALLALSHRVLLIDGDIRRATLSRRLYPTAVWGLQDVLSNPAACADVIRLDALTGADLLPSRPDADGSPELLASPAASALLQAARNVYDVVIVDLPPLAAAADARALAHWMDGFIFTIAWGAVSPDLLQEALPRNDPLRGKILGCVLNRTPGSAFRQPNEVGRYHYGTYARDNS